MAELIIIKIGGIQKIPLASGRVSAGFPSPADDYIEKKLDLNEYLIRHPAATFFVRVSGDSMSGASMHPGDILIVDRALKPISGKIVIAILEGDLTVKRIQQRGGKTFLVPENPAYTPMEIHPETSFEIWGVVTHVIHSV